VIGRIPILDVEPAVDCGRRPAKAVSGETFEVSATIFREGHGLISAGVVLRDPLRMTSPITRMRMLAPGTDRWGAEVAATGEGRWRYHVEAWADPIATWHHDAAIKIPAGQDVELMLTEGRCCTSASRGGFRSRPGPGGRPWPGPRCARWWPRCAIAG
jgi:starch synthase (maltosyl-transferring)